MGKKAPECVYVRSNPEVLVMTFSPVHKQSLEISSLCMRTIMTPCCSYRGYGKESTSRVYLLSNDIRIVAGLDLECAVICPEIYRVSNAGYASLINLIYVRNPAISYGQLPYQFCSLSTGDRKLKVGILFPISKKQWKFGEKTVVDISCSCNRLGIGVAVEATL